MPAESTPHAPAVRRRAARKAAFERLFERLEERQLLSTVSITSFGAVSGDGKDDSAAIIAAMRQTSAGDVVSIPAGDWNINRRIDLKNNISVVGAGQKATNVQVADGIHAFRMTGEGNTLSDMHIIGGLLFIDGVGSRGVKNLNILRNYVEKFDQGSSIGTGGGGGAIGAPGTRVDNVTIADNTFQDARRGMAMYMWTGDNWLIADNAFLDTNGGIKSNNAGATAHNIRILRNYWSGTSRMGAELQGQVDGFWFQDNFYENPVFVSSNFNDNIHTFAFSLIYHGITTRNAHINRNTILAPQRPDGTGVRLAFEGGNDLDISDNYINGVGTVTSIFMGDSSGGATTTNIGYSYVQNNKVLDARWGIGSAYGPIKQKAIYRNNGPDTVLTWDINRGRPGPGGGFDHAPFGGGGGIFDGDPDPDPTPGGSIPIVSAFVMDATRITLTWTDTFTDEQGFRLERSMDGGKTWKNIYDSQVPNKTVYTDKGLPSGTQFWYRVFKYKKDGTGVHSNIATGKTKGQPPTRPPTSGGTTTGGANTGGTTTGTTGVTRAYRGPISGGTTASASTTVVGEYDSRGVFGRTTIV